MPQDVQSAHPGRGTKRHCPHCGTRYYDLERRPVLCPKCHREYVAQAKLPPRPGKAAAPPAPALSGADDTFEEDEALPLDHVEGEEALIEEEEEREEDEDREE